MKEKIKDTIVDLLLDGVKEKLDSVKENYKWQKLFVSTGDFFVNNPDVLVKFEDDLYSVFSKDNLIRIAKRLKDKNGYDFSQLLHNELYDLMVSYEIPIMETETYIHHFMQVIITYLEENDSDKALEMFLGDMRKEIGTYFAALESKLELVLNQISNLNKEKITTYSIADIDAQIRRETKYKGMGLDFFKLDDEQFESKFQNSLNDTKIYVVGKSREETTYRILNELKNKNSKRITLVVKSEKEWNKLQHSNLSGNILVPFFYADRIVVIPNNTNIFIYGEDEPCYTQNKLILRKRTKRNIIDSLEELGIDANEAYKMVDNTHGLYVPLKKKLFDGAMYDKPDWVEGHSDVVIAALLCGQWTEATGDVLVFEELSGKAYSDCKKELGKYLHRENPYIVSNNSWRGSNMQLASVEDAWEELDLYINDEMWDKFISLFYEVLIESEPIFEYPFEKHFEASIYAKKPEWSPTLKKGMIRTLIMRAYYRGHEENQKQIDNIVAKVLDTITSKERWGYISQYFPELCEASPESVLRKLESEIEVSQGLIDLFAEKGGDFMTSRHYYTNVLWAVEQLIQQKKYVARALEWLWEIDSHNIKFSISNSPKGVLDVVFCASDVYLFAKVLWMTLKGDNIGFRGQYQRGDVQIFLNKENFGDVITLEPIHKLIEQATFEDMNKRISIHQCIDYLELQCNLLDERERELLSNELISRLLYDEHSKMIIERTKPDELIYEDKGTIFSMLRGVIPISKIMVKSLNDEQKAKQIQLTDFQVGSGGICKMLYFNNGIKVKEYIMEINKMTYSHLNLDIVLELNDIDSVDKEYVAYSETVRGFGNMYPKIYFSSDEKIIITKVK